MSGGRPNFFQAIFPLFSLNAFPDKCLFPSNDLCDVSARDAVVDDSI